MADIVPTSRVTSLEPYAPPVPRGTVQIGQVNAVSLWKAFRARWALGILAGLLLGAGAGAAAFFGNPARYNASALIRVLSTKGGIFEYTAERVGELQAERARKLVAVRKALEG